MGIIFSHAQSVECSYEIMNFSFILTGMNQIKLCCIFFLFCLFTGRLHASRKPRHRRWCCSLAECWGVSARLMVKHLITMPVMLSTVLDVVNETSSKAPRGNIITTASSTSMYFHRSSAAVIVYCLTIGLLWVLGLFGNILVCVVIHRSRRLQSTTNSFVVSLACTDLLLNVIVMPLVIVDMAVGHWVLGSALCKLLRFTQWLCPSAIMFVLSCICIDRFYSIIYPLSFKITRGRAKRMILAGWIACCVLSSPCIYLYDITDDYPNGIQCMTFITDTGSVAAIFYICFLSCAIYFLPVLIDTVGYFRIFRFIWFAGIGGRSSQRTVNPVPRTKVKMVKMMLVVTVIHIVFCAPFIVVQLWHFSVLEPIMNLNLYAIALWFLLLTAIMKPATYMCFNSNFRRGCKEVFCMSTMKCYRSYAYTITTASKLGKTNHVGIIHEPVTFNGDAENPAPGSVISNFERSMAIEKSMWSVNNAMPSTYLWPTVEGICSPHIVLTESKQYVQLNQWASQERCQRDISHWPVMGKVKPW